MRAFIYACSALNRLEETARSASSCRNWMPEIARILYVPPSIAAELETVGHDFSEIIPLPHIRHKHRPRFEAMAQCRFDQAIFVDCDTFFLADVSELFDVLLQFDIGLCFAPQHFHQQAVKSSIYQRLPSVSKALPEWNSGVIVAQITFKFRQFVEHWSELFQQSRDLGYEMDQPALRAALAVSGLRIATLPNNYNFRAMQPQAVAGKVKILHAHGALERIAARINSGPATRLFQPAEDDAIRKTLE